MNRPIYYFDLGNTRAKFWRCEDGAVKAYWAGNHEGHPERLLGALPEAFGDAAEGVFGCSVLSAEAEERFTGAGSRLWGCGPEFARTSADFMGIRNAYRAAPARLGIDRWLGIIGGAGDCDVLCVVGCGTAITIDVLDGDVHKGGYILPGLRLMQDSLLTGTGRVRFDQGAAYSLELGDNTGAAVHNAAAAAAVALVEKVVASHKVDRLILTGGDADVIAPLLSVTCRVDHGLLLAGLMRYFAHRKDAPT